MKKIKPYLINTLIVIAIFIAILIISKTSPFGNNTLGTTDAINEYKPLLYNFIMSIKENDLSSFSFNNGLGNPTIFTIIFYLASPLNLIALLFNNADLMLLSTITLKLILTSIFVTFYCKQKNSSNTISLIATISYTLSGSLIAYYYNITWLDAFMIFPLIQYSLEKLIKEKKIIPFIFSLSYVIITSISNSFPIIIYTIIYFVIYNFFYLEKEKKGKIKTLLMYILSIILSSLLCLTTIFCLLKAQKTLDLDIFAEYESNYTINAKELIKTLYYGSINTIEEDTKEVYPNIGLNTLIILNIIYFFLNKKQNIKDKLYVFIVVDIILLCLFISPIDYFLNFFHNSTIPYQYSYIITFLSIMLFLNNSQKLNKKDLKKTIISIPIIILLIFLIYKEIKLEIIIINIIFLITFGIIIYFFKKSKLINILICLSLIIETSLVCYFNIPTQSTLKDFDNKYTKETTTYRLNNLNLENEHLNSNLYYNQSVTYLYNNMTYQNTLYLVSSLGCQTESNIIVCNNDNILASMLLNVKNEYYLEKIFTVSENIKILDLDSTNVKRTEENLIESATNITNIFKETILTPTEDDTYYYYKTDETFYLIDDQELNYAQNYTSFKVDKTIPEDKNLTIYTLDQDKLEEIYNYLSKNQIQYTHYEDNYLEGTINVDENQIIFTSIPYDEAWEIKVDGEIVGPTELLDSLIGIEVEEGTHTISLEYKTDYLKIPVTISIITFLSLCTYEILSHRKLKKL